MNYTDLVFDLYGTLVDIHTEEDDTVWEKTALYMGYLGAGYTGPQLREAFHSALRAREAKAGQSYECFPDIPFEEVMEQLLRDKGLTENTARMSMDIARLFRICSTDYIRLYPHVTEALASFRADGYRLWLLSNAQAVFTTCELRHLGLAQLFDGIYLSSDYRCRKPDIRFFRALMEERKLNGETTLMIGNDRNTDIAGARCAGMATLYMHTALTPPEQREADPALLPGLVNASCRHYEFEGDDWLALAPLIRSL